MQSNWYILAFSWGQQRILKTKVLNVMINLSILLMKRTQKIYILIQKAFCFTSPPPHHITYNSLIFTALQLAPMSLKHNKHVLPQDLCTCYSCCLELFSQIRPTPSLPLSDALTEASCNAKLSPSVPTQSLSSFPALFFSKAFIIT